MARPNPPPSRLDRLKLQRAQVDAKIKALEARNRTQSRKDDTRRKIITGALALEHMQRHEAFAETMLDLLDRFVTRPQDRALFDLPPLPATDQDNEQTATGAFAASSGQG